MAIDLTTEEKFQIQSDVLWTDVTTNPNLTTSSIPSKNKQYTTTSKRTIGAVNELKSSLDTIKGTVDLNLADFISILGDYNLDTSLRDNLEAIGPNILAVIKLLHDEIQLLKQNQGTGGGNGNTGEGFKAITVSLEYTPENLYNLAHINIPEDVDFELTINGIEVLECTDYRVDRENGILYWEDSASYELAEGDRITAQYYIGPNTQERVPAE